MDNKLAAQWSHCALLLLAVAGCQTATPATPLETAVSQQLADKSARFQSGEAPAIELPAFIPVGMELETAEKVLTENRFRLRADPSKEGERTYECTRYVGALVSWSTIVILRHEGNRVTEVKANSWGTGL